MCKVILVQVTNLNPQDEGVDKAAGRGITTEILKRVQQDPPLTLTRVSLIPPPRGEGTSVLKPS